MKRQTIVLIAGWARPSSALTALAEGLRRFRAARQEGRSPTG